MLVRASEQKVATTVDWWVRHLHARGWKINNSRVFYLSEIARGPIVWGISRSLLSWKTSCCIWLLLQQIKWHNAQWASLNFVGNISLIWVLLQFIYWVTQKIASFVWCPSCSSCSATWVTWSSKSNGAWSISEQGCYLELLAGLYWQSAA